MNTIQLLQRITGQVYHMSPRMAMSLMPIVERLMKGQELSFGDIKQARIELESRTSTQIAQEKKSAFFIENSISLQEAPKDSFAIMRINGVIQNDSDICNKGLNEYAQELEIAGLSDNIKGVLLEMNSGGGTAIGGDQFAKKISDFEKTYNKPLAALIKNVAASAGYEVIAPASRIFVASGSCEAGSIGTMAHFYNNSKALENEGYEELMIRATLSFNKNEEWLQAQKGNVLPMQKNILDPLNKVFHKIVKSGRKGKIDLSNKATNSDGETVAEALSGKIYFGQDIINIGLADEIGDRAEALKYLSKQARKMKNNSNNSKTKAAMIKLQAMSSEELETEIKAKQTQLEALNKEESEKEVLAIEQEIQLLNHETSFRATQEENKSLIAKNTELESQLEMSVKDQNTKAQETIEALEAKAKEDSDKLSQQETTIQDLQAKIKEVTEQSEKLQIEKEAFQQFVKDGFGEKVASSIAPKSTVEGTEQPEAKKSNKVVLSAKEQAIQAAYKAKKWSNT